jgi:hypothetical protein
MGSRNRQRATFQKRQREMARQERQAEKRARRQGRAPVGDDGSSDAPSSEYPGHYPDEHPVGRYPDELPTHRPPDEPSSASSAQSTST